MSRQIQCPNCGADHTLSNPGITMVICQYCKTPVYWGEDMVLKMGAQSILPESDSRLFMHATGKMDGRGYEVVGHVRYDHGRGAWDEWYLQMDDGGVAWISEDERKLTLEQATAVQNAPALNQLQIGAAVVISNTNFTVREIGQATCVGGEGQLPFTILPGERYPYADVASLDGQHFATLEYDEGTGRPTAFFGRALGHEQISIDDEKPPSTAGSHQGKHVECANCAAPLEISGAREVLTQVCEYCGAQLALNEAESIVMGQNPKDFDTGFVFDVGQAGTFNGQPYEVCGRMLYEDEEGYRSIEYLLHNPDAGYLWLAEETGHYVLNRPTNQAPGINVFSLPAKTPVTVGNTQFRMYEAGKSKLVYVDGALPWIAKSGDSFSYADLTAPPNMFGIETDGQEVEYFHGRYMSPAEVWQAFTMPGDPPRAYGVHPAQPFTRSPATKILIVMGFIFAAINLTLLFWSFSRSGTPIFSQNFQAERYLKETMSRPFRVGTGKVMSMRIQAPLNNSWLALDVALMNDKNQVVGEVDGEISYYRGVEGGERWSEGNQKTTRYFRAPPPGVYRLILKGSGGTGNYSRSRPGGEPLNITIRQGGVLSRYFVIAFFITFLYPFFAWMRKFLFEKRRWAPVTEDDDDDDDDFDWD